ncbi:bifunctional allantoicase/(S)-ureidoglycine aminohydrolase [Tropicibacter naphthalenivorans]|uniref:Putative allantoin catabolism protein n=1 Tax=Tropicibacter naphthalenivorans TaxID=441103 RepID=A0A0P1H3Q1_9RHOB|nr:bifunctional allantoicase/(S)-ureidoglycine aminohydrolase [Tropicibacter naphthalenivorans]CUH82602.1 putative allantoin catabolism protein [Tropicibacter naphthalenivorans]SMD09598.1 (S)-ureidoglycine aminohydrolase [Tropicibacter naphthalenivorans]
MSDIGPRSYAFPPGGLPPMDDNPEGTAIFTESYAVIPANTMRDIVTSFLPGWSDTRAWIIARPLTGFAETFAQYAVEVAPGGGSDTPEPDAEAQAILLIANGAAQLTIDGAVHEMTAGGYASIPAGVKWTITNPGSEVLQFHWIRKRWEPAPGIEKPTALVTTDAETPINWMPGSDTWGTTRFVEPTDLRHDCHGNIVTFLPGGQIPFAETHVMEHGLYVLQGTARYLLNKDWVEVGPGDFMWLRAFCPQACIQTGDEPFRYLLYKDVNRHVGLSL